MSSRRLTWSAAGEAGQPEEERRWMAAAVGELEVGSTQTDEMGRPCGLSSLHGTERGRCGEGFGGGPGDGEEAAGVVRGGGGMRNPIVKGGKNERESGPCGLFVQTPEKKRFSRA